MPRFQLLPAMLHRRASTWHKSTDRNGKGCSWVKSAFALWNRPDNGPLHRPAKRQRVRNNGAGPGAPETLLPEPLGPLTFKQIDRKRVLWVYPDDLYSGPCTYCQIVNDFLYAFHFLGSGNGCITSCVGINKTTQADHSPIDFHIDFRCRGERVIHQCRLDT